MQLKSAGHIPESATCAPNYYCRYYRAVLVRRAVLLGNASTLQPSLKLAHNTHHTSTTTRCPHVAKVQLNTKRANLREAAKSNTAGTRGGGSRNHPRVEQCSRPYATTISNGEHNSMPKTNRSHWGILTRQGPRRTPLTRAANTTTITPKQNDKKRTRQTTDTAYCGNGVAKGQTSAPSA